MSKSREAHRRATEAAGRKPAGPGAPAPATAPGADEVAQPLKPQRGLFIAMSLLLIVLAGALLALYFTTVYPHRHDVHVIETDYPNGQAPAPQK